MSSRLPIGVATMKRGPGTAPFCHRPTQNAKALLVAEQGLRRETVKSVRLVWKSGETLPPRHVGAIIASIDVVVATVTTVVIIIPSIAPILIIVAIVAALDAVSI